MRCPKCSSEKISVTDTRSDDLTIRRRRECLSCSYRFSTIEQVEFSFPVVIKKDGKRENYRAEKIRNGLIRACQKRQVSIDDIDATVQKINRSVAEYPDKEIPSDKIGDIVVSSLKELDQIAYLRFVSVYRGFTSIDDFEKVLSEIKP